jgi:tRNA threonylcarbamoyladenosine biosynthesis protein TsaB
MSTILALDSSTDACSVALLRNGEMTSLFEMAAKSHTQRLLPMVDEVLQQSRCDKSTLDAIAFGRGPGSFTGLRICLGVVQGLAFGLQLPVIPVSTLAAMAAGYFRALPPGDITLSSPLLVALDARMSEVYWGLFRHSSTSLLPDALTAETVMQPAKVLENNVVREQGGNVIGLGPGWHYPDLQCLPHLAHEQSVYPHAEEMAILASELWSRGEALSVLDAQPVYLRDEVSWQRRQRIRAD